MNLLLVVALVAASPETYYLRATQQNQAAMHAAYARHDAIKARIGDRTVRGTRTVESSVIDHRFGGGAGYNGLGGEGGYAGYNGQYAGGGSGFGFNYGFGYSQPGNHSRAAEHSEITAYEKVWYDDTWYGGPVTILNPFCPPEK